MEKHKIPRSIPDYTPSFPPITSETFDSIAADQAILIVHFWAVWNGYDPIMESRLAEIQSRLPESVHIASCNIDDASCLDLAMDSGVVNIPWVSVFIDGQHRGHICGLRDSDALVAELTALIEMRSNTNPRKWWRFW